MVRNLVLYIKYYLWFGLDGFNISNVKTWPLIAIKVFFISHFLINIALLFDVGLKTMAKVLEFWLDLSTGIDLAIVVFVVFVGRT